MNVGYGANECMMTSLRIASSNALEDLNVPWSLVSELVGFLVLEYMEV